MAALIALILAGSPAVSAQGLSGWVDVIQNYSSEYEDGEKISDRDRLNRNVYMNFRKEVTPLFSYQINLRGNFTDTDQTDENSDTETTYRRTLEPGLDLFFGNPVYDFTAGYRRLEDWDTASLQNDSRSTTEFYYSRLNISPERLPTINLQYDMQKNYDHFDDPEVDDTSTTYSIGSTYILPSQDVQARYTVNYARSIDETPLDPVTIKQETDSFSGSYSIGYSGIAWNDIVSYFAQYQGNFARTRTDQFVTRAGTILNERSSLGGLYAQGDIIDNDVDVLNSRNSLVDGNLQASTGIGLSGLGSDEFQNIGIFVSSDRPVDRLYIYVDRDISGEVNLTSPGNWKIYRSNFNQTDTWTEISGIRSITIDIDTVEDEFRYVIEFTSPEQASFFKAVNLRVSNIANVEVTEIEAYGTDTADEDILTTVSSLFNQGINFNTQIRALSNLTFGLHYILDRRDQNPLSVPRSIGGVFENIFSDSISGEKEDFRSTINRNYGASSTWLTHRLLTTIVRVQRSESFDNREETDVSSNTYNLTFTSAPLPTLDASLSFIKNDSFSFDEKDSRSNSILLSVGSRLYRDVNMITDLSHVKSNSFDTGQTTTTNQITGNVDAVLTSRLSGTFNYGLQWSDTDSTSTDSKRASTILTYRPGRFINLSGNVNISDINGDVTLAEGVQVDWLPLRAIRLNMNYLHSDAEPGPIKTDTVSGYVIWYITKFADVRFNYNYTVQKEDTELKTYNFLTDINCRF
ncbi:MAG: hypothetical protein JSU90_01740 [Nitrospiraceae bacterium]|nr:MAG: hypothetical protein JSU90_01740 [Nitrospiraceae bacterium]